MENYSECPTNPGHLRTFLDRRSFYIFIVGLYNDFLIYEGVYLHNTDISVISS